jgi:hypothetical protein
MSYREPTINTTQNTKDVGNRKPTINTTQKIKEMSNSDPTINTTQKTNILGIQLLISLVFCVVFMVGPLLLKHRKLKR